MYKTYLCYLSSKLGRKGALIFTSVPFLAGWLFIAYAPNVWFIFVGRSLTGVCVGLVCATTPAYLVEISTPEVRGLLGASFQFFVVVGVLIVNLFGSFVSWNWEAAVSAVFGVVALLAIIFVPESPRWLVAKGNYQEAIHAVKFLQGPTFDAAAECVAINEDLCLQPRGRMHLKEFLRPGVYKPLLISIALVFFQQFCGSNAILFYTVEIFRESKSPINPDDSTILVDAILVVATGIGGILSDRAGRKVLLLSSGIGMAVSLAAFGTYQRIKLSNSNINETYGWVPLLCVVAYIAAFSIGYGPIPWLVIAELSPVRFRSFIGGAATACCWGFVFVITRTFLMLVKEICDYRTYWIYAGFSALSCFFTYFGVPETKGKPFEEISELFTAVKMNQPS